ncbi:MAG: FAD/NAD(P)-binding oxidoreductase [Sulfolobales archaeon]
MKKILILGGGAGGAVLASRLAKKLGSEVSITVLDKNLYHEFRPSYLWIATGYREPDHIRKPLTLLEKRGVRYSNEEIRSIDLGNRTVTTDKSKYEYDYLVVSLGAVLKPEKIKGLDGAHHAWELSDALKLRSALSEFRGGKVVIGPTRTPYRCPPAPIEIAFMIRYLATIRGFSDKTDITVVHPDWSKPMEAFGPFMSSSFEKFMEDYKIQFIGRWRVEEVDPVGKVVIGANGEKLKYDLAILVPPHEPAKPVADNPDLIDKESGFMSVDKRSLRHPKYDEVYGIGDIIAPTLKIGMAGVFAHFQADYVATRLVNEIKGVYMGLEYNRTGICVMDLGFLGAGAFCDFGSYIDGKSAYPDCYMLGGMSIMRILKIAFERMWFKELFG